LYGRQRYDEFAAFLDWLVETIQQQQVDVLLVAGDIFDTTTPSHRAQALYYKFLTQVAHSACRHIVIIAGNHDSPSFLSAPENLLRALDVHVIGAICEQPDNEVLILNDAAGQAELIVCAVPYLRDRDIRSVAAGESIEDKQQKLIDGIAQHYVEVCQLAEQKRQALGSDLPIIAMGHLFTAGGKTIDGDGVRELYVGSLAHVTAGIFPECIDYLALGHLHVPQKINDSELMRYSGSPIPMGFGEAKQQKSVCLVNFKQRTGIVSLINVPCFQKLQQIKGHWQAIESQIKTVVITEKKAWLEIIYEGDEVLTDLRERLETELLGTGIEVLRVKNNRIINRVLNRIDAHETLDDLNENDVFERCLNAHKVAVEQRTELLHSYQQILTQHYQDDADAE
jgi:exonuclease SbcD